MRTAEVMTKDVQTISPDASAADAWELMRRLGIHHLIVMVGSQIGGVLSDRDAGGRAAASLRAQSRVRDLMTSSVVTVGPRTTIRQVANLMRGRTIGCLPVVDRGRLVGILTVSDLLDLVGRGIDRPVRPQRPALHHRVPHRKHKGAAAAGVW